MDLEHLEYLVGDLEGALAIYAASPPDADLRRLVLAGRALVTAWDGVTK